MKFIVDCMLGKLAKWLKILGFDTLFFSKIEDSDLLALAQKKGRTLLTRDTELQGRARGIKALFIESENWHDQVEQVLDAFNLRDDIKAHSRCIDCNVRLKNLPKKRAKNLVTPFVYEHAHSFALCSRCGRVFWQGTHFKNMEYKVEDFLNKEK